MPDWQPIAPGTLLQGRYEVEAVLGRGGFGATYRARDRERFGEVCALKELLPTQAENPKARELFEREARTLLGLRHPGIPAFHAFFFHEGRYFLVEDFVSGKTLAQELKEKGKLSAVETIATVDEVLNILDYLHGRSPAVIHRDVKPANIIRSDAGAVYLVDFGAVKEAVVVATLSAESTIIATSGYTPPEQLRGLVLRASDLYAVGATALHLLSGRPPSDWFDAVHGAWGFAGHLGVSPRLESILARLLEQQPARRYQSAAEVREALRNLTEQRPVKLPGILPAERAAAVAVSQRWIARILSLQLRGILPWSLAAIIVVGVLAVWLITPMRTSDRLSPVAPAPPPIVASAPAPPVSAAPPTPPAPEPRDTSPRAPEKPESQGMTVRPPRKPEQRPVEARVPEDRRPPIPAEPRRKDAVPPPREDPPVVSPRPSEKSVPEPTKPGVEAPRETPSVVTPSPPPVAATPASVPLQPPVESKTSRTYRTPLDQVWRATERALKLLDWDIDGRDRGLGVIVTESRKLKSEGAPPFYVKETRHRLRLRLKSVGEGQTTVVVERLMFKRERFGPVFNDEPLDLPDQPTRTEESVLTEIERALR